MCASPHTCSRSHARLQLAVPQRDKGEDEDDDDDDDDPQDNSGRRTKHRSVPKSFWPGQVWAQSAPQMTGEGKALAAGEKLAAHHLLGWQGFDIQPEELVR